MKKKPTRILFSLLLVAVLVSAFPRPLSLRAM